MLRQSVSGRYISYVPRISFSYQIICVSCNSSYLIADNFATPRKKRKSLLIGKFACYVECAARSRIFLDVIEFMQNSPER